MYNVRWGKLHIAYDACCKGLPEAGAVYVGLYEDHARGYFLLVEAGLVFISSPTSRVVIETIADAARGSSTARVATFPTVEVVDYRRAAMRRVEDPHVRLPVGEFGIESLLLLPERGVLDSVAYLFHKGE